MKLKKDNKTMIVILVIIGIMLVLVLLLTSIINSIKKSEEKEKKIEEIKQYTSVDDFKTVEEVTRYLECEYKKEEASKDSNYNVDIYMKIKVLPYTDNNSNEAFYSKLISYIAKTLNFQNFRIIDEENKITIEVITNKETKNISNCIINGEINYFDKRDSELQIKNYKEVTVTNLKIQSNIINKLISNNWIISNSEIGTKESTFNSYDIFFDEGVEIRKVNNKVFNIIFTENYKDNLLNNIKTSTSREEIIKKLGKPTYEDEVTKIIGYKGKNMYVFFNTINKQISIYRVESSIDNNKFDELYKKFKEEKLSPGEFVNLLKDEWNDYDSYKTTSDYIKLQYTLRGMQIQYNVGSENGIVIYNNYDGIISDDITLSNMVEKNKNLPDDIFLKNENLVFVQEKERANYVQSAKYMARMEKESRKKENDIESNLFIEDIQEIGKGNYSVRFISLDGKNPNSELKENINSGLWINDNYYIYAVKQKGIYLYDAKNMKYTTIVSNNKLNFEIKQYKDGILKYDDKAIKINI